MFVKTPPDSQSEDRANLVGPRMPRHSTGWAAMLRHLQEEESLQILDVGPTSASNVNFLTSLGHSLYMADLVFEAHHGEWPKQLAEDPMASVAFFEENLNFSGKLFDVVLLWTTLDYIPEPLIAPTIERLHASLNPQGKILAFFHTKRAEGEPLFYRYHVTESETVELQQAQRLDLCRVYNNRSIERLFSAYRGCKFFLAKDNLSEVIVTR